MTARFGDSATRVLLAVMRQYRPTMRSIAQETGLAFNTVQFHLRKLQAEGLADWTSGTHSTLHAKVLLRVTS